VLLVALAGPVDLAMADAGASARSHAHSKAKQRKAKLRKAKLRKARARRALMRAVRRNPRVVLRPGFMRKASLLDFDLPVTVRLNPAVDSAPTFAASNDQLALGLGTGATAAPLPVGVGPGTVNTTLSGGFSASLLFGRDTSGFASLGTLLLGFDQASMTGTGFDLVTGDPACGDGPLLRTEPTVSIAAHPDDGSFGYVGLFTRTFAIDLHTRFSFHSEARATCAGALAQTALLSGAAAPPVVLHLEGEFRIAPAITADGRLRLARMSLQGVQQTTAGFLHTCVAAPPGADPCDGTAADAALPLQTTAAAFTAEMLVGPAPTS
jgi:hypothetical protein